jgi:hypothetical protein
MFRDVSGKKGFLLVGAVVVWKKPNSLQLCQIHCLSPLHPGPVLEQPSPLKVVLATGAMVSLAKLEPTHRSSNGALMFTKRAVALANNSSEVVAAVAVVAAAVVVAVVAAAAAAAVVAVAAVAVAVAIDVAVAVAGDRTLHRSDTKGGRPSILYCTAPWKLPKTFASYALKSSSVDMGVQGFCRMQRGYTGPGMGNAREDMKCISDSEVAKWRLSEMRLPSE